MAVPRDNEFRSEFLKHPHDQKLVGHLGVKKTLDRVKQRLYCHGCTQCFKNWCRECDLCASWKRTARKLRARMITYNVGAPLERVALDVLGPLPTTERGNKYILVIADYFTKWTESYSIPDQEAVTVATKLVEEFVSRFGVPRQLHSDQGRNFESAVFTQMCSSLSIDKTRTTALHPQYHGMVERFNQTLEAMLSKLVDQNQ